MALMYLRRHGVQAALVATLGQYNYTSSEYQVENTVRWPFILYGIIILSTIVHTRV